MRKLRARDVMTSPAVTVRPDTPVVEAARIMARRRISGLPVVDEDGCLVGIVTEADLLLKEAGPGGLPLVAFHAEGPPPEVAPLIQKYEGRMVEQLMTREVVSAQEDTPLHQVAALMARKNVNRVPIVRGRQVVGVVSRNDVLKAFLVDDQELAARVEETLEELGIPAGQVQVQVKDGVVHLRGQLASPADARLAALCVRVLDGVVAVDTEKLEPHPEAGS